MLQGALLLFGFACTLAAARADMPSVVVTIKPIHAIVSSVMLGVAKPTLLLPGGASPHAYAMRPADARRLRAADLIVWVGPQLESFLVRPLRTVAENASVVTLMDEPGILRLEIRKGGHWEDLANDQDRGTGRRGEHDAHIWLDPENGKAVARIAADRLARLDPANGAAYHVNAARFVAAMTNLAAEVRAGLGPVRRIPFIVFHDAYQYLEHRFALNAVGSLALSPELKPGARRLYEVRQLILAREVRCIFSEPQFRPALVDAIIRGTDVRTADLDLLGTGIEPGPDAYEIMMRRLVSSIRACLLPER